MTNRRRHLRSVPDVRSHDSAPTFVDEALSVLSTLEFLSIPAQELAPLRGEPDLFWAEYDRLFRLEDSPPLDSLLQALRVTFRGLTIAFRAEVAAAELQDGFPGQDGGIDDPLVGLLLHLSTVGRDPEVLACALALAAVGRVEVRGTAALAVARLRAAGVRDPKWASFIGRAGFERAFHATSVTGEMTNLVVQFTYGHRVHAVVMLIDRTDWARGGFKDAWARELPDADQLQRQFDELEGVTRLTQAEAATMMDEALSHPARPGDLDQAEFLAPTLHLLAARRRAMQPASNVEAPAVMTLGAVSALSDADELLGLLIGATDIPLTVVNAIGQLGPTPHRRHLMTQVKELFADPPELIDPTQLAALAPYQWFLEQAADGGIELTAAGYLKPALAATAAAVLPSMTNWFGPVKREVDATPLLDFRTSLQKLKLLRKYKGRLLLTRIGQQARRDPEKLWNLIADSMMPHDDDEGFGVDAAVLVLLSAADHEEQALPTSQIAEMLSDMGWRHGDGAVEYYSVLWLPVMTVLSNLADVPAGTTRSAQVISTAGAALARTALRRSVLDPTD